MTDETPPLLEFPTEFSIKAMGVWRDDFMQIVRERMSPHVPDIENQARFSERESSGGKYVSITVNFRATSQEQLDAIYQTLVDHPAIKFVF